MAYGFGIARFPERGREPETENDSLLASVREMAQDIRAIRERVALPHLFQVRSLTLAAGQQTTIDTADRPMAWLIVSVYTGQIDLFIGDGAPGASSLPHMRIGPTTTPVILPLSPQRYRVTVLNSAAGTSTASVICVA